jgi:hypothetical protein
MSRLAGKVALITGAPGPGVSRIHLRVRPDHGEAVVTAIAAFGAAGVRSLYPGRNQQKRRFK